MLKILRNHLFTVKPNRPQQSEKVSILKANANLGATGSHSLLCMFVEIGPTQ